jgi:monooxygenase
MTTANHDGVEHHDVVVIGAGISGIGAGYRLQTMCPDLGYVILEARDDIGGTWDLFRYPGVRSDSDMFTLGYPFRPWTGEQTISDGASILDYVRETARTYGIDRRIRFRTRLVAADWDSATSRWRLTTATADGRRTELTAGFLYFCSGYYRYDEGYTPDFPGMDTFRGRIVHPQRWPEDLDTTGSRVVVIGSGATAVTLVPALAGSVDHVTMLQRSPSYVVSLPARDPLATAARRWLPERAAYRFARWKNYLISLAMYEFSQRAPRRAARLIRAGVEKQLEGAVDVDPHFAPRYGPWDQRLCLVPDGDLFEALRTGRASIVTDEVESFTPEGVRLASGQELPADVVVTATGFSMQLLGGAQVRVDGEPVAASEHFALRGAMLSGVPNAAMCIGYTNASWTLRADLVSRYVCRLLRHMHRHGYAVAVPEPPADLQPRPILNLSSGYVRRAEGTLPKQGSRAPWDVRQNYVQDLVRSRLTRVGAGLRFSRGPEPVGVEDDVVRHTVTSRGRN